MLNKLLIKFLIVTSFFVNYKVDANSNLYQEKGIRGTKNGYDKKGRSQHYALKISHSHRDIKPKITTDNKIEKLLSKRIKKDGDLWITTQKFLLHQKTST